MIIPHLRRSINFKVCVLSGQSRGGRIGPPPPLLTNDFLKKYNQTPKIGNGPLFLADDFFRPPSPLSANPGSASGSSSLLGQWSHRSSSGWAQKASLLMHS